MLKSDFRFKLPAELIAQEPVEPRSASRLLVMDRAAAALADRRFIDLVDYLRPGDLLVFNDTRVIPARLLGRKDTGGQVEILIERVTGATTAWAQVRASKAPRAGTVLRVGDVRIDVASRRDSFFELAFDCPVMDALAAHGHVPLPPYIERGDRPADHERYQTVYAREPGAVAAPTAGLHFDRPLLEQLGAAGVESAFVTLHVGAGTFQPIRVDDVREHRMHSERYTIGDTLVARYAQTRETGGRVVAVGTTSLRALESAWQDDRLRSGTADTDIFIYPGRPLHSVDALITNFHLPESTLLMLVCAFAGTEPMLAAYRHAVDQRYRFFSYGDAMLIL